MKIQTILNEVPIQDVDHEGDFNKSSSFRHARDRRIVSNPAYITKVREKFGKVKQNINILFVNTPQGNRHTEVGEVSKDWIKDELGENTLNKINNMNTGNAITIIFTNNKGDQRVSMTPWILAHRMMHVFARETPGGSSDVTKSYRAAADNILRYTSEYIMPYYFGYNKKFPDSYSGMTRSQGRHGFFTDDSQRKSQREKQLFFKYLFQEIGTFRSARDNKLRDWFEVINELGAQYLITGKIKFNEAPKCIGPKNNRRCAPDDRLMKDQADEAIQSMGDYFELKMEKMLDIAVGRIFVM